MIQCNFPHNAVTWHFFIHWIRFMFFAWYTKKKYIIPSTKKGSLTVSANNCSVDILRKKTVVKSMALKNESTKKNTVTGMRVTAVKRKSLAGFTFRRPMGMSLVNVRRLLCAIRLVFRVLTWERSSLKSVNRKKSIISRQLLIFLRSQVEI